MIKSSFNRLGLLVQQAIYAQLRQEYNVVQYRKLIAEYTSAGGSINFQVGRTKQTDVFPAISIEADSRRDEWAATNYTKDITYRFKLTVAVKTVSGEVKTGDGSLNQVEAFSITLAEFTQEILNEPIAALQYDITQDQDGNNLVLPVRIYDSLASDIAYSYLYNGALRSAQISWMGKIMRVGPCGGLRGYQVDMIRQANNFSIPIGVSTFDIIFGQPFTAVPVWADVVINPPTNGDAIGCHSITRLADRLTVVLDTTTGTTGYTANWLAILA